MKQFHFFFIQNHSRFYFCVPCVKFHYLNPPDKNRSNHRIDGSQDPRPSDPDVIVLNPSILPPNGITREKGQGLNRFAFRHYALHVHRCSHSGGEFVERRGTDDSILALVQPHHEFG